MKCYECQESQVLLRKKNNRQDIIYRGKRVWEEMTGSRETCKISKSLQGRVRIPGVGSKIEISEVKKTWVLSHCYSVWLVCSE
jgi:hypothetical protein